MMDVIGQWAYRTVRRARLDTVGPLGTSPRGCASRRRRMRPEYVRLLQQVHEEVPRLRVRVRPGSKRRLPAVAAAGGGCGKL